MMTNIFQLSMLDLANYAIKNEKSKGRRFPELFDDGRVPFQRDKDRIIHSKAFRRLDRKTQVLVAGSGDHYRTRLTHSIEVAQIARDLARRLRLNEDLCEAIALAHDLGHTPFGHAGQDALNQVMQNFGESFEHNEQSRRIVEFLEKGYPTFDGLNLTIETIDGLIKHQTAYDQEGKRFEQFAHLEAQIVNVSDEIAYLNHDVDDGLRLGAISIEDLEKIEIWRNARLEVEKKYGADVNVVKYRERVISSMMSIMIDDFCATTEANLIKNGIKTVEDVEKFQGLLAHFSEHMKEVLKKLRQLLYDKFYMHPQVVTAVEEGQRMIKKLFKFYYKNPDKFPLGDKVDPIRIKDYIAGMTDNFLMKQYKKI